MSHYADSVLAERPSFLDPVYYERPQTYGTVASVAAPVALPLSQGPTTNTNSIWPPFCEDPAPLVQSVAFAGYDTVARSVAPSSLYPSPWQSATLPSATTSAISIPGFQQNLAEPSSPHRYRTLGVPSSVAAYPQRSPPQTPPRYESPYEFRNQHNRSPDSQLSTSEHTGWASPKSTTDDAGSSSTSRNEGDELCTPGADADVLMQSLASQTSVSSWMSPVKVEPEESTGCFIMELPPGPSSTTDNLVEGNSLQTWQNQLVDIPAEVPLRATGASKKMRRMMNAFRVNPFSMHSLSVRSGNSGLDCEDDDQSQATWCGGEARPLDEEPQMFEFQLDLEDYPGGEMDPNDQDALSRSTLFRGSDITDQKLRSFSPDFELRSVSDGDQDTDDIPTLQQPTFSDAASEGRPGDLSNQYHDQDSEYTNFQSGDIEQSEDGDGDSATQSERGSQSATAAHAHGGLHGDNRGNFPMQTESMHDYHDGQPSRIAVPGWDTMGRFYQSNRYNPILPPSPSVQGLHSGYDGIKVSKLHSTSSHPYLRKSLQNHHAQKMPDPGHHRYMQTENSPIVGQAPQSAFPLSYPLHQTHGGQKIHDNGRFPNAYQQMGQDNMGPHQIMATQESPHSAGEAFCPSYTRVIKDSRDPSVEYIAPYGLPGTPSSEVCKYAAPSSMTSVVGQISTSLAPQEEGGHGAIGGTNVGVNHRRWSLPEAMSNHGMPPFSR